MKPVGGRNNSGAVRLVVGKPGFHRHEAGWGTLDSVQQTIRSGIQIFNSSHSIKTRLRIPPLSTDWTDRTRPPRDIAQPTADDLQPGFVMADVMEFRFHRFRWFGIGISPPLAPPLAVSLDSNVPCPRWLPVPCLIRMREAHCWVISSHIRMNRRCEGWLVALSQLKQLRFWQRFGRVPACQKRFAIAK